MPPKAVVLLSGGLDSVTCLAVAKKEKFAVHALCFDYGQRHKIEIECARRSAARIGVEKFHLIQFDLRQWAASALTSDQLDVPEFQEYRDKVPITYVPARNLIFLSFGTALAEGIGSRDIFIGVNSVDYSGYPDCRPEFIQKFQELADYATTATAVNGTKIKLETPLQNLSKKEIVQLGSRLGAPLQFTHSCYKGGEKACGVCDSCKLRLQGFAEAGVEDPVEYETRG